MMPQLTDTCEVWRLVLQENGKKQKQAILTRLACLKVPISKMDVVASPLSAALTTTIESEYMHSEARASTDVFLLPDWVQVRPDDEIRRGRRTNNAGTLVAFTYNVDGIQDHGLFGYQNTIAVFCTLLT
jgi:hypothetical protein